MVIGKFIKEHILFVLVIIPLVFGLITHAIRIVAEQSYNTKNTVSILAEESVFDVNESFLVNVLVNTNCMVNAVEAEVQFPADSLEVLEVSRENSILDLWVQEPVVDHDLGLINFSGVVLYDGC